MAYLLLVCPFLFVTYFLKQNKRTLLIKYNIDYIFLFVLVIIMTLFFGLRYNVGKDYMSYYNNAKFGYYNKPQKGTGSMFEPAFVFLYAIGDFFDFAPNSIFILSGFILFLSLFVGIYKSSESFLLSFFIFFGSGLFFFSFNELRQFVAVCIILNGYRFASEKKIKEWCLICFIAFLFHKSAIFVFPFYFFNKFKLSKKLINLLIIVSFVIKKIGALKILCFCLTLIPGPYASYADTLTWMPKSGGSGIIGILYLVIVFSINNFGANELQNAMYRYYFYVFFFGAFFSNVFSDIYLVTRLMEYYLISIVVIFPLFIKILKKNNFTYIFAILVILLFSANFIKYSLFSPSSALLEYHTVFNKEGF